jgi:hypothetical protein
MRADAMKEAVERTIIAASPGWFLANAFADDGQDKAGFYYTEIIAWEIVRTEREFSPRAKKPPGTKLIQHMVTPITTEGLAKEEEWWAIKTPAGKWDVPFLGTFDSEAEALKELLELLEEDEQAHAAAH